MHFGTILYCVWDIKPTPALKFTSGADELDQANHFSLSRDFTNFYFYFLKFPQTSSGIFFHVIELSEMSLKGRPNIKLVPV